MSWQRALSEFVDGPDEGWLELRRAGDRMGFAPSDAPSSEELEQLQTKGWQIDRLN